MKQNKQVKTSLKRIRIDHVKSVAIRVSAVIVFILVATGFILFARGYRLDFQRQEVSSTGILAISSSPKSAQVFINGEFRGVTDLNLNMPPGQYTIEVKKDGYIPYTRSLTLKGELVEAVDPILFPVNPSLTPVTNLGVTKAISVGSTGKILVFSESGDTERDGVYIFTSSNRPLTFLAPLKPILLKSTLPGDATLGNPVVNFSNDYRDAVIEFESVNGGTYAYVVSLQDENVELFDVDSVNKETLLSAWEQERNERTTKILEAFPKEIRSIASDSFSMVHYSPDETKILYQAQKDVTLPLVIDPPLIASNQTPETRDLKEKHTYVYDMREDKNYHISDETFTPETLYWYNDSKRLVYREKSHIVITLYDGQNRQTVYSGPIEQNFISVNPDGKILILANLNPAENLFPDLYQVGIR